MGIFDRSKIQLKEPFSNKYRLTITSDIQAGNMPIATQAEIRWEVKVKDVKEDMISIEILTLDNQLIKSNNPLAKTVADASQAFSKMYNELDLIIDKNCRVLKIVNLELIREKWQWIKSDLEVIKEQDPTIGRVITLNEEQFANHSTILKAIQNNEFFSVYFHHFFGKGFHSVTDTVVNKNLLNTACIEWQYRIDRSSDNSDNDLDKIVIEGFPETKLNKNWTKEAYKDFSHLDLEKLKPVMHESGVYLLERKTGKIVRAALTKKEIVHPQLLHATIQYDLRLENGQEQEKQAKESPTSQQQTAPAGSIRYNPEHSFVIDE